MKTERNVVLRVHLNKEPLVELDRSAKAAYVTFREGKAVKTKVIANDDILVTADLDENGEVLGLEFVGIDNFNLNVVGDRLPSISLAPQELVNKARYAVAA